MIKRSYSAIMLILLAIPALVTPVNTHAVQPKKASRLKAATLAATYGTIGVVAIATGILVSDELFRRGRIVDHISWDRVVHQVNTNTPLATCVGFIGGFIGIVALKDAWNQAKIVWTGQEPQQ